jgi:hypothetical protein
MSAAMDSSFFGIYENIVLTKHGVWLSNGEEILHEGTVRAFSRNVHRAGQGFEIHLGPEKKIIHVEDTLYFVVGVDGSPQNGFKTSLNDGRTLALDPATLQYRPGRLTCRVIDAHGSVNEEAKFLSQSYYQLLDHIEKKAEGFVLTIQNKTILLSSE